MTILSLSLRKPLATGACLLFVGAAAACGRSNSDTSVATTDTTATATTRATGAPAMSTSTTGMADSGTAGGDTAMASADQEFLQKMSDHHAGLIRIAHGTLEHNGPLAVKDEAKKLDSEQDDELARMKNALKGEFNVPDYKPSVMPEHQAMADSLSKLSGSAYDRQFRMDVIKHHKEAVAMIDQYLPRMTHADIKTMAERMRASQMKEIAQFQQQLNKS